MPKKIDAVDSDDVERNIRKLIANLVELKDPSGEFLLKLDDGRVIDTKGWNDWEWTHGIGLYGIYKYYELSNDAACRTIIEDWFHARFRSGTPTKNVNTMAPMLTLAYLYEETRNKAYLPYLDIWAEWVMNEMPRTEDNGLQHIVFNSENPQQLWDDTLMMTVLPLAKIGLLLGRRHYIEEARHQFLVHIKYLFDRKSGLWFHGWTFDGRHNFAEALWARGNCWVTIAIPEIIELLELPPGEAFREFLIATLRAQVEALSKHQDKSGLWHTLIVDRTSYLEASAAAGFAYGILKSVRNGYLPAKYREVGLCAVRGVLANISTQGELQNVSFGTAMGSDLEFYKKIPLTPMPYGQALAILCLSEYLRARSSRADLPMQQRRVRFGHYLAYGSNDFLGAGAMAVISGWILFFYTTFCGLTAVEAAAIFAIARLLDAVASPLIGYVSDHFHRTRLGKRFGRRRFFVLLAVPLLPSFALMWVDGQTFWYYLFTYVFFELVYAMEIIPYETLAAEMSPDYRVKAKFAGARILFGQVSAILAGILPGRIIEALGKDSSDTFLYMGVIFSVIFMLVALAVFFFSWERPRDQIESIASAQSPGGLGQSIKRLYSDLWATMKIRAFRLHLGMYLGGYISQDIFNAVFTYFIVFALGSTVVMASNLLGAMAFAQLIAVALFIPLCLQFHPGPSYRLAVALFATGIVGFLLLYRLTPANLMMWVFVPVLIAGLGRGGLNYIPWNTYNYMADVDEIVTGRRREGAFAGVMTFIRKTTQAIAVMSVGLILQAGGFVSGSTTQTPDAIFTILVVLAAGTLALLAFGFVVSLRFHLNRHTHGVLMDEIERFKAGGAGEPSAENRRILEDLTGWSYEELWGRTSSTAQLKRMQPRTA